jgi:diguanylate cyclase (GGDEF)-like protein
LTDLCNRSLFDDRVEQALARTARGRDSFSVLVIDLDDFKFVNDRWGHSAGDLVLVETARRLRSAVRPGDSVARIGGDEFAVLCEGADADQAGHIARRIRQALELPIRVGDGTASGTGSIGIALYRHQPAVPVPTPAKLLQDADHAMYQAKDRRQARPELRPRSLRSTG